MKPLQQHITEMKRFNRLTYSGPEFLPNTYKRRNGRVYVFDAQGIAYVSSNPQITKGSWFKETVANYDLKQIH